MKLFLVSFTAFIVFLTLSACSNEALNSMLATNEERIQKFKNDRDHEIGMPLLGENCKPFKCTDIDDEYFTLEIMTESGCSIAWIIRRTIGEKYIHPSNGIVFEQLGIKERWHYISDPALCLDTIDFLGPW